jgi:hypothetical protein
MRYATGLVCAWLLAASGCALEAPDRGQQSFPSAGLYTPGSTLGASDPTDTPQPGAGLGNRCVSLPPFDPDAGVATEGTFELEYTTMTLMGRYWPRNCTAVWIETPAGQYVATIELTARLRRPGLVYWQDHACTEKLGPDAVTSATLPNHDKPHMAMWSGRDFEEKPVADGMYKLFIEVTETDKDPGEFATFDFMKGPAPYEMDLAVPAEGPITSVKIAWKPGTEGSTGGATSGQ